MKRFSSTSIRTFLDCPRKAVFEFGEGKETEVSAAMAKGTITHAILEQRFLGLDDSEEAVRELEGNYDDPREALDAFPDEDIWGIALETADVVGDPREYLEDHFGCEIDEAEVEFDLEENEVFFRPGGAAGGYIDLLLHLADGRLVVFDWKTRSRMDYIPRTEADFRADPQLCYYAAALLQVPGFGVDAGSLTVAHGNLLRADCAGGPKAVTIDAELPVWYLQGVWDYLEGVTDEITEAMAAPASEAKRTPSACYKYGPCPHLAYCQRSGKAPESFFSWARNTNLDHLVE